MAFPFWLESAIIKTFITSSMRPRKMSEAVPARPAPLTPEHVASVAVPILRKYGVTSAAVFGSVAKGEARPGSDVDLLVEYEESVDLLDVAHLRAELETVFGCRVDLVSKKYVHRRMRDRVLSQAISIM